MSSLDLRRAVVLSAACILSSGIASASSSFSFTGSFYTDDQLQEFVFTLTGTATVTTVTFGYAGGTNQASQVIPEGGFDPWLAIFNSSGNLLFSVDNGTCGQVGTDSVSGQCLDSYISESLSAGTYTLVLSQSDNQPVGNTLSDGYTDTGDPTFTGSEFGCSNGQFCDFLGDNRTGNWAVDIDNVSSATELPEPGTVLLSVGGLGVIGLLRRRRSRRAA